jgi:prepilin-type N-terminal cleavage/methylation domain-containing protein
MTLIEVMVAMLIGTVALCGALALVGTLIRGSSFSRQVSEASALAQSKLEELVVLTPMPPDGTGGDATKIDAFGVGGSTNSIFKRIWAWSTIADPNTAASRRQVMVTVTWKDALGGRHTVIAQRQRIP